MSSPGAVLGEGVRAAAGCVREVAILTIDQSDAVIAGIFSRGTNPPQKSWVYTHDRPIRRRNRHRQRSHYGMRARRTNASTANECDHGELRSSCRLSSLVCSEANVVKKNHETTEVKSCECSRRRRRACDNSCGPQRCVNVSEKNATRWNSPPPPLNSPTTMLNSPPP
eukprot:104472-Prorocentrum_minimum.AAC.1